MSHAKLGFSLKWYPFSLVLVIVWACLTGGTIVLLELQNTASRTHQPWYLNWLPSVLLTIFAQGHSAVTATHLARLAISGLQDSATAPRTWAELFWLSNRDWDGPVGLASTFWGRRSLRTRISSTFILFALTMLFALPTPLVLSRAYPLDTVTRNTTVLASTLVPTTAGLNDVDWVSQLAVGSGAWTTSLRAVQDMYGSRAYEPSSTPGSAVATSESDIFFSGSIPSGAVGTMPGIRTSGGCWPLEPSGDSSLQAGAGEATSTSPGAFQPFTEWCSARGLGIYTDWSSLQASNADVYMHWCTGFNNQTQTTWQNTAAYQTTVIAWLNTTDGTRITQGFMNCTATFSIGNATVNTTNSALPTFDRFTPVQMYDTADQHQMPAFYPPLFAAFFEISQSFSGNDTIDTERLGAAARMFGYVPQFRSADGSLPYVQPTLQEMADSLWRGTTHMSAAIGLLGSELKTVSTAQILVVQGRQRNTAFALAGAALLLGWLAMLICLTTRMFRRTFGHSLDSYAAARLLVDLPFLVDNHCCGNLSENPNLRAGFLRVGDFQPGDDMGHVTSGGVGMLDPKRTYGAGSEVTRRAILSRLDPY